MQHPVDPGSGSDPGRIPVFCSGGPRVVRPVRHCSPERWRKPRRRMMTTGNTRRAAFSGWQPVGLAMRAKAGSATAKTAIPPASRIGLAMRAKAGRRPPANRHDRTDCDLRCAQRRGRRPRPAFLHPKARGDRGQDPGSSGGNQSRRKRRSRSTTSGSVGAASDCVSWVASCAPSEASTTKTGSPDRCGFP